MRGFARALAFIVLAGSLLEILGGVGAGVLIVETGRFAHERPLVIGAIMAQLVVSVFGGALALVVLAHRKAI